MNNELERHKTSDKIKWVLTLLAFILVGVMLAGIICGWFDNKDNMPEDETQQVSVFNDEGAELSDGEVHAMPKAMTIRAAAETLSNERSVDVRIEAYVYPTTASNKQVDFSVAWGTGTEHGSAAVSDYLTVTPDSDGGTLATVKCKKAFGNDKIIITVTTRDGGYTAKCTVSFAGKASGISITSSAPKNSNTSRGSYYELGTNKTYTFNVNLTNSFNNVKTKDLSVTLGAVGSLYFGVGYCDPNSGITKIGDVELKNLSDLKDRFITSATISGTTITVQTGKQPVFGYMNLNDYYTDEYDNYYYRNCYLYEDEWGLVGPKYTSDASKCTENETLITQSYFTLTVTDSVSGISETIKLWVESSVSGVSLSNTTLEV